MVIGALRVVFFGTPEFAVPTFDALLSSRHEVVAVVTRPDRPRGRGHEVTDAPVKARAMEVGLPILQPDRLKDPEFATALAALRPDLGVVAAYGKILSAGLLGVPRLGMINVHASLLPKYRGAAPVHRALIAGERETGVTIMRIVQALDAGPMLAVARRPILPDETSDVVERDLAALGVGLLVSVVDRLAAGPLDGMLQDESKATYARPLTKADGLVDWTWSSERIHNLIRGLHPWPHAFTFLRGRRYILLRSAVSSDSFDVSSDVSSDQSSDKSSIAPPGTITAATGGLLVVAAGHGSVRILQIQSEGGRPMGVREFLAGHRWTPGDRFGGTP